MFLNPVTENEILNIVKSIKSKTSVDLDDISMLLVKKIIIQIVKPLKYICNASFQQGLFPDKMKTAKILPLFKSGSKKEFTNYRPVLILPQFSKILEKLFVKRLDKFINKFDLLDNSQYGFRSGRSTSLALLELTEEITKALDNKKLTIGVYVDLKKAFDTINHSLLFKKLEKYGFRGIANNWIRSYLNNRSQFVSFKSCNSDLLPVVCGILQGSVLGPKLFILYINDICNVSKILKFILFADDTNIFYSGTNLLVLNNELKKLRNWFDLNKLSLNILKTNYMIFSNKKCNDTVNIFMKDCLINRVQVTKFLGVMIDEALNWKSHILYIKSKLSKILPFCIRQKIILNQTF